MHYMVIIMMVPFVVRTIVYIYHLFLVDKFLKTDIQPDVIDEKISILIMIPVLREQNVIEDTIRHFISMNVSNANMYLIIAGTNRERNKAELTTLEVVDKWIAKYKEKLPVNIDVDYCEANDVGGDRATQLNFAVKYVKENKKIEKLDVIGVYDADSLPSNNTLQEVINNFIEDKTLDACQQPVHFAKTATAMSEKRENPMLVANALYQSTWTAISELPMWIKYYKKDVNKLGNRHLYLIGHGEFITDEIYNKFKFPEYEITDGIQIGYRLGMTNRRVKPLREFCNDDVPHTIRSVIMQHKRWYGGCMNFRSSYKWAKSMYSTNAWMQCVDILWSQMRWAWTAAFYILLLIMSFLANKIVFVSVLLLGVVYCYCLPVIAHKIMKAEAKVRLIDWLCIPFAIGMKSIGPNIFILSKLTKRNIKYEKVER